MLLYNSIIIPCLAIADVMDILTHMLGLSLKQGWPAAEPFSSP